MNSLDKQYIQIINDIFENGTDKGDRTGTGTRAVFGRQIRIPVSKDQFPVITLKKVHFDSVLHELLWFLSGNTNIKYLQENNVPIWNEWADENGDLGPVYGYQWRHWPRYRKVTSTDSLNYYVKEEVDQIRKVVKSLRKNPNSRRHMVSAWNVSDLDDMALQPCHYGFQFNSRPTEDGERKLDILVNQRSCDIFLGVPYNLTSYSLLLVMMAQVTNHQLGELIWVGGDVHLYNNHVEQAKRACRMPSFDLPSLEVDEDVNEIDEFRFEHFELKNHEHGPFIKAPIAV